MTAPALLCAWCHLELDLADALAVWELRDPARRWYVHRPSSDAGPGDCFRRASGPAVTHGVAPATSVPLGPVQ